LQKLVDDNDKLQEMLRENILAAMRTLNAKVLEGSNGRKLRRQNNGGVVPVEVVQPELVPESLSSVTWRLPASLARLLVNNWDAKEYAEDFERLGNTNFEPNLTAIRKELERRVPCPQCGGKGERQVAIDDPFPCETCGGTGEISSGVPGCRLGDRGEHVRVL
jgi:hypothetical protein